REETQGVDYDALLEIFLRTSGAAFQRRPHRELPARSIGRVLDVGENRSDFCCCEGHSVPSEALSMLPNDRRKLIVEHFSSCWLDESCEHIRWMHERFVLVDSRSAWGRTVDIVNAFFKFNLWDTPPPPVFSQWLGRVFETEVKFLEERISLGRALGVPPAWGEIATSLADV